MSITGLLKRKTGFYMRSFRIESTEIDDNTLPFVIAEIGHNHQGKLDKALELIQAAAQSGVSAVKFQKRSNAELYTPEAFNEPYNSENSFGKSYGLHREALELGYSDYIQCKNASEKFQVLFFATPFDFQSVDFLLEVGVPAFKIASGDLSNHPLISYMASTGKPLILSTGGSNLEMIHEAVEVVQHYHNNLAILQCTASYPANYDELNLRVISTLRDEFPNNVIGYSGHDNGIAMSLVAYMLGARIIEKHFTLNRSLKGTDHAFSLEPQGMSKLVRDFKRTKLALGDGNKRILESELAPIRKMSKAIVAARNLPSGHLLTVDDLSFRSPGNGLPPSHLSKVIGRTVNRTVLEYELIRYEDLD